MKTHVKNTLLLVNGNIDETSEYNKTQIGDQSGNYWIDKNEQTIYSEDTRFLNNPDYHKSIKLDNSSVCVMNDPSHLMNFSNREFCIEAWIKFDIEKLNEAKKHTILSKWVDNNSVTDEKIFRFFYDHTPPSASAEETEIRVNASVDGFLFNDELASSFTFQLGNKYNLFFGEEFKTLFAKNDKMYDITFGLPDNISFESRKIIIQEENITDDFNKEYLSDIDDFDNVLENLSKNLNVLNDTEILESSSQTEQNSSTSEIKPRSRERSISNLDTKTTKPMSTESTIENSGIYGVLNDYVEEIDGGISIDLRNLEPSLFSKILISLSYELVDKSSSGEETVVSIEYSKEIENKEVLNGEESKLVFEYNGLKGYDSEYRDIHFDKSFNYYDKMYYANETDKFSPTTFSDLIFDSDQLDMMNPDIVEKLDDTDSKVWVNQSGIIFYPKFKDFDLFYLDESKINLEDGNPNSEYNLNYTNYLSKSVDRTLYFLPIESHNEITKNIKFKENPNFEYVSRTYIDEKQDDTEIDTEEQSISYIEEHCVGGTLKFFSIVFDYSVRGEKDIIISVYSWDEDAKKTIFKENIRLSNITGSGRKYFKHTADNYIPYSVTTFVTEVSKNWSDRKASHTIILTEENKSSSYKIDAFDSTDYTCTAYKHSVDTANLIDGEWHHLVFGKEGIRGLDRESGHQKIYFGIDGVMKSNVINVIEAEDIPYLNRDKTGKQIEKLVSIQPFYEANRHTTYSEMMGIQEIRMGSDGENENNSLCGIIDSMRVNEFSTYETADELETYYKSNLEFNCWLFASDANNYCIFDENTEYNLSNREGAFGVDFVGSVIRYTNSPTNPFEALKCEMGSVAYLNKIMKEKTDELTEQDLESLLEEWRWKLKFVSPSADVTKTLKKLETFANYAEDHIKEDILNE